MLKECPAGGAKFTGLERREIPTSFSVKNVDCLAQMMECGQADFCARILGGGRESGRQNKLKTRAQVMFDSFVCETLAYFQVPESKQITHLSFLACWIVEMSGREFLAAGQTEACLKGSVELEVHTAAFYEQNSSQSQDEY